MFNLLSTTGSHNPTNLSPNQFMQRYLWLLLNNVPNDTITVSSSSHPLPQNPHSWWLLLALWLSFNPLQWRRKLQFPEVGFCWTTMAKALFLMRISMLSCAWFKFTPEIFGFSTLSYRILPPFWAERKSLFSI